jgi:hypothetical protein
MELFKEWRALTVAEAEAIQEKDWHRLEDCQNAKAGLTLEIGRRGQQDDRGLRPIIDELIAMESENQRALAAARLGLEAEYALLEQAGRTVRQVSRAYGADSRPTWQSYS